MFSRSIQKIVGLSQGILPFNKGLALVSKNSQHSGRVIGQMFHTGRTAECGTSRDSHLLKKINNKHLVLEKMYEAYKTEKPATNSVIIFLLQNAIYGALATGVAYFFKSYIDADGYVKGVGLEIETQSQENILKLEKMRILRAQPFLYLTTNLTEKDRQDYAEYQVEISQQIKKLENFDKKLDGISYGKTLISREVNNLKNRIQDEILQLTIVAAFNETIWLQKNRQYDVALKKNKEIITQLRKYQAEKTKTLFNLPQVLAAAYNAQAKLQACLAFFSEKSDDVKIYRENSAASYDEAIKLMRDSLDNHAELATVLSSKGYLLVDCERGEEALLLQKEANRLKPNDEHILCGIAVSLYEIEVQKKRDNKLVDRVKLDESYGYFSRALQLNNKFPNIYVSRGKLLLELGYPKQALEDFESALVLDKNHSEANLQKAFILLEKNNCEIAEEYFKQGILPLFERSYELNKQKQKLIKLEDNSPCRLLKDGVFLNLGFKKL